MLCDARCDAAAGVFEKYVNLQSANGVLQHSVFRKWDDIKLLP